VSVGSLGAGHVSLGFASLDRLGLAAFTADLDGHIRSWNRSLELLYGSRRCVLGAPMATVLLPEDDGADAPAILAELLRSGRWERQLTIEDSEGVLRRVKVRAAVTFDIDAAPIEIEAIILEETESALTSHEPLEQAQLALTRRIPGWGSWSWDPSEDELVASERFTSLLGLPPGTPLRMVDALAAMPLEDRERVESAIARMRSDGLDSFSVDYRVSAADGSARWLQAHCDAVRGADGELTQILGITTDTTATVDATEQLARASEFWQGTLDSLTAHVAVLDDSGDIVSVNQAWRRFALSEGGSGDYIGTNYVAVCESAKDPLATQIAAGLREIIAGAREEGEWEYPGHAPDEPRWFVLRATRYQGPGPVRVVLAHENVTARHEAEAEISTQAALLDEVDFAVVATEVDGRITHWNRGAEKLYGWTRAEAMGRISWEMIVPAEEEWPDGILEELHVNGTWEGRFDVRRKDGSVFPAYFRDRMIPNEDGTVKGVIGISMDVSERIESERALRAASEYLQTVTDSVGEGLFTLDAEGRVTYVNPAAEELLGWSAAELRGRIMHDVTHSHRRDGTMLAVEDCPIMHARQDSRTVRVEDDVFTRRDGRQLAVAYTASPFSTDDGIQGCVVVFQDISERKGREELALRDVETLASIARVQDAISSERLLLYEQPIIDLRTREIVQRELLLRVREPGGNITGPAAYLPIAEQYGLIGDIDRWVIKRGVEHSASGRPVQINLSARSISDPTILDHIELCITQTNADPQLVVFEITETALVEDEAAASAFAQRLRHLGCKLALDDFGTGYSSFTYLKHIPVDYLKIDIEFVRDLATSSASRHVVEAVVALARGFSLKTVGEGVEDARTLELLVELGVDFAQGYYIGRPAAVDEVGPSRDRGRRHVPAEHVGAVARITSAAPRA
jgi:PAS domain S-box-containing protein